MRPLSPIFSPDVLFQFSAVADSVVDYTYKLPWKICELVSMIATSVA